MNQTDRVLAYMQEHGSITQAEAFTELGCTSLARRICDLQDMGIGIIKILSFGANRYGEKVRFVRYMLGVKNE